ncbi:MAG: zinc finger domain-containing protein [Candidatus Hodarchaeales archaeon]
MSSSISTGACSSCQRSIPPDDIGSAKFHCPNCGLIEIRRCTLCRYRGNEYVCPNCGFKGP